MNCAVSYTFFIRTIRYFFFHLYTSYIIQTFFQLFSNATVNSIDAYSKMCYNFVRIINIGHLHGLERHKKEEIV